MSATVTPSPVPQAPGPRHWTRDEFYRLAELGFFRGERVELVNGMIRTMSPQNLPHQTALLLALDLLDRTLEVYRVPRLDAASPSGWSYTDVRTFTPGRSVNPLAAPGVSVAVDDLLP